MIKFLSQTLQLENEMLWKRNKKYKEQLKLLKI